MGGQEIQLSFPTWLPNCTICPLFCVAEESSDSKLSPTLLLNISLLSKDLMHLTTERGLEPSAPQPSCPAFLGLAATGYVPCCVVGI